MIKIRSVLAFLLVAMILAAVATPVSAVNGSKDNGNGKQKYIVVFNDQGKDKKDNVVMAGDPLPGEMKYKYKVINAQVMELTDDQLAKVKARKDVKYVEADAQAYADLDDIVRGTNTTIVWRLGYTGRGVNVSVIDSGIDVTHPDLTGKVILWKDFLNNVSQPYDDWGHGTHVADIIAGTGNGSGGTYTGVAPEANLFGAKVLNSSGVTSVSDVIAAIDWSVENHADVISLSLSSSVHIQALDDAVHNAVADGVVVVCSAGNTGPSGRSIKCPSDSPDAITVGSADMYNNVSSFSSRGPTYDGRIKPDILTYGENIVSARAAGTNLGMPIHQYYTVLSGTSMACPQVSAACAILLQVNPDLTPADLKNVLQSSARPVGTTYPNNNSGWGILNVGAALNKVKVGDLAAPLPSGSPTPTPTATPTATPTSTQTPTPTVTPAPQSTWKTYVSNYGGTTVSVINQTTDTVTATITTGSGPFGIAYSPDGSRAYVAVDSQSKVSVISTASDTVINSITVGRNPHGVVMSPDGSRLYVGNYGSGTISVIDTSDTNNYRVISTISGITKPHELWISPDGSRLYVSTYQANNVYVIDTANDANTIVSTITGNRPYFISLDPAGTRLFVANYNSSNIQVYDTASLTLQATINTTTGPLSPIISPDGSRLYYVTDGDNKLTIAYASNYTAIKTVACGPGVRGIACSPDGSKVYVTNMNGASTSIVSVTNDAGTFKSAKVGTAPYGLGQFAGYYPVQK